MRHNAKRSTDERSLRFWLVVFLFALIAPAALLVVKAYEQLKWETFHQYRLVALESAARVHDELARLIDIEESRPFGDYTFLSVTGDEHANFVGRSTLSEFPVAPGVPGLVGYFQIDDAGALSSPTVPDGSADYFRYGVSDADLALRIQHLNELREILTSASSRPTAAIQNAAAKEKKSGARDFVIHSDPDDKTEAVSGANLPSTASGRANVFDALSRQFESEREDRDKDTQSIEGLKLDVTLQQKSVKEGSMDEGPSDRRLRQKRAVRKEQGVAYEYAPKANPSISGLTANTDSLADVPEIALSPTVPSAEPSEAGRIRVFESEIGPLNFHAIDQEHFSLSRNVWRDGRRFIQGAVIEYRGLTDYLIEQSYTGSALAQMSELIIATGGTAIARAQAAEKSYGTIAADDFSGSLLHRLYLPAPVDEVELLYVVDDLPIGSGGRYLGWLAILFLVVLISGCFIIYRYGIGQITLNRQQRDFVAAVSHELKTPLTSIRMYSEMLKAGWAAEDKKAGYYAFIHDESERLSRLINNVLQLARMTRNDHAMDLKAHHVRELLDVLRSKIATQIDNAGFEYDITVDPAIEDELIEIDTDAFQQIMINLVDNAIKFTPADAAMKVNISCDRHTNGIRFVVRDFGKGIATDQMRRIFELFYRAESELTRETVGTGIGLALVKELSAAMGATVDVRNCEPGAEFTVTLKSAKV